MSSREAAMMVWGILIGFAAGILVSLTSPLIGLLIGLLIVGFDLMLLVRVARE